MNSPNDENIALVINGFAQFRDHILQTKTFNPHELLAFMEPKFAAAGYRTETNYNNHDNSGGQYTYFDRDRRRRLHIEHGRHS